MGKPDEIKRDRWQRPLLPHPMTSVEEAYTRASTLSNAIDNTYDLEKWKSRRLLVGISQRPDLIAKVQSKPDDKNLLNEIVETAMEVAGSNTGSNLGTAIHSFCEMIDNGQRLPTGVDPRIKASIKSYLEARSEFKIIASEEFVATRAVMAAGTFDRILQDSAGKLYVADIKTGANAPDYAHSAAIQMATYSRGQEYSPKGGWGFKLPEDLGVDQEVGILIHLPSTGEPVCRLYRIDLAEGWRMARIAHKVRNWWKEKPTELM